MKPTRNRVYCPGCMRSKMLFQDKAKVINFLRFNREEIEKENGYAPCRAYYCKICGGWHLTSQSFLPKAAKPRVLYSSINSRSRQTTVKSDEDKPMLKDQMLVAVFKKLNHYEKLVLRGENLEMLSQTCKQTISQFVEYRCPVRLKPQLKELLSRLESLLNWIRIIPILNKANQEIQNCSSYVDSQMIQAAMERHVKARVLLYQASEIEGMEQKKKQLRDRLDAVESRMNTIWEKINITY